MTSSRPDVRVRAKIEAARRSQEWDSGHGGTASCHTDDGNDVEDVLNQVARLTKRRRSSLAATPLPLSVTVLSEHLRRHSAPTAATHGLISAMPLKTAVTKVCVPVNGPGSGVVVASDAATLRRHSASAVQLPRRSESITGNGPGSGTTDQLETGVHSSYDPVGWHQTQALCTVASASASGWQIGASSHRSCFRLPPRPTAPGQASRGPSQIDARIEHAKERRQRVEEARVRSVEYVLVVQQAFLMTASVAD